MWGALTIEHWMRALAAAVLLALGVAVLAGRHASRLRLPFVALCVSLFSWNLSSLAYQLTRHREFHVLDRALSPLTIATALHFVVVFVGRRKKLGALLVGTYAWFGGLTVTSLLALVGEPPLRGRVWALLFLVGLGAVVVVGAILLARHLRVVDAEERGQTQRVLVALVGGMLLGSTELLDNFGVPVPPSGAVGTLFAAVVLAPLATRASPLGESRSRAIVLGAASAALCVVLYLGVFELLGNDTLALVLGTTTLTLLLIGIAREVIARNVRQRARRDRLTWLGRMSDQLAHDLKNPLAAMRGAIQLLQEDRRRGRSLDERAELIGLLDDQIARMMRVIEKYRRLGRLQPELREVDVSAMVADVVGLLRHGGEHEIVCELGDLEREEVLRAIAKAMALVAHDERAPAAIADGDRLLGESRAMEALRERIARVAPTGATVLLRGETGTGKELAARAIHRASKRAAGPMVTVNCAALPENLLESELFGHVRGAFTGAVTNKPGRVELAQGGTLFLDEIGELSPPLQAKLLRLLQEREYQPVGSSSTRRADVRFLAATHQDLEARVQSGEFREDLYFRLVVVPVDVPALRDRRSDIRVLARAFFVRARAAHGREDWRLDDDALDVLAAMPWPGNVRELQNAIERLVILGDGPTLDARAVGRVLGTTDAASDLRSRVREAERGALIEVLESTDNRAQAARVLGISRRTLYNKLEEHGLL